MRSAFGKDFEEKINEQGFDSFTIAFEYICPNHNYTLRALKSDAIENNWRIEHHDSFFQFNGLLDFHHDGDRLESKRMLRGLTAVQAAKERVDRLVVNGKHYIPRQLVRRANWLTAKDFDFSDEPLPRGEYFWMWQEIKTDLD